MRATTAHLNEVLDMSFHLVPAGDLDYRLNLSIWSMQSVRRAMLALGMAYDSKPPGSIDPDRAYSDWTTWRDESKPGIPIHKLVTNDGWYVSSTECQQALVMLEDVGHRQIDDALRAQRDPGDQAPNEMMRLFPAQALEAQSASDPQRTFVKWMMFMANAADNAGFYVW